MRNKLKRSARLLPSGDIEMQTRPGRGPFDSRDHVTWLLGLSETRRQQGYVRQHFCRDPSTAVVADRAGDQKGTSGGCSSGGSSPWASPISPSSISIASAL